MFVAFLLAATVGLSALVAQSALAFAVVKDPGAAYLVYVGIRLLLATPGASAAPAVRQGARRALRASACSTGSRVARW